jgi:hypothetical protein
MVHGAGGSNAKATHGRVHALEGECRRFDRRLRAVCAGFSTAEKRGPSMKFLLTLTLPLLLVLGAADEKAPAGKDEAKKEEAKCPISGKPINKEVALNVNGQPVYFCCPNCPKAYKQRLAVVEDKEQKCPLSGKPVDAATVLIHKTAAQITFCCGDCRAGWAKKNKIEFKEGTGKCPISGKPIDESTALVVNGQTVAFCCKNCQNSYTQKELGKVTVANEGKCPTSGKPGDPATSVIHVTAKEVGFCCKNCQAKYVAKNFAGDAEKKAEQAEKKEAKVEAKDAKAETKVRDS